MKTLRIPSLTWAAIMLCSMMFAAAQDVAAEVYMTIGGKDVTSDNYQHITAANGFTAIKSGSVDYDPSSARLTLDGATIEAAASSGIQFSTATTVLLIGANAIMGPQAIIMNENVTITGSGSLACTGSSAYGININKSKVLTIDGCTFAVQASTYGIQSMLASQRGSLIVNNANVRIAGPSGSICKLASMSMTGCGITLPEGAAWTPAQNAVCDASGNIVTTEIQIERLVPITSTTFPNSVFRQFVGTNYDADHDGHLSESEIAAVTSMEFRYTEATSLQGIEYFAALEHLSCNDNQIAELDLSQNLALKTVLCQNNQLTSLNIGNATQLQQLYCNNNQLSTLNVANFPNLHILNCQDNQLSSLSFAGCATLENVFAFNNRLTALDLSGCSALRILSIYNNSIKQNEMDNIIGQLPVRTSAQTGSITLLDPGPDEGNEYSNDNVENAELKWWYVYGFDGTNPIYIKADYVAINVINFPNANFRNCVSTFDTNQNGALSMHELQAATMMNIANVLIRDIKGIEHFTALRTLDCSGCNIPSLDLSQNISLTTLHCEYNALTELDLSANTMIREVHCYANQLTPESIRAMFNSLPRSTTACNLTIYKNDAAEGNDIMLTASDVDTANGKGWHIHFINLDNSTHELTTGAVRIFTKHFPDFRFRIYVLQYFDLDNDVLLTDTEAQAATSISVSNQNIGDLTGIEFFPNVETLDCSGNHLTFLDVSRNTNLTDLQCQDNQIAVLSIIGTDLYNIACYGNQIQGKAMQLLFNSLPDNRTTPAYLTVYSTGGNEGNDKPNAELIALASDKNWNVLDADGGGSASLEPIKEVMINEINFPDDNFRAVVSAQGDKDCDGILSTEEILNFRAVDANERNIESMKGIELLIAVENIHCVNNQLTRLDLSKNTRLKLLLCGNNQLTTLNISGCPVLQFLNCTDNQLNTLDLSHNTELKELYIQGNFIRDEGMDALVQSLPTVNDSKLFVFSGNIDYLSENLITSEQIYTANSKGWRVIWRAALKEVSLAHMPNNSEVAINATFFPDDNFRQFVSETYDTNQDGILQSSESIEIVSMDIREKNIADLTGLGFFEHLKTLNCHSNQLSRLDLSYFRFLTRVDCYKNQIQGDDMEKFVQRLLPMDTEVTLMFYYTGDGEQNAMPTNEQISIAADKNWLFYTFSGQSGTALEPTRIAINETNFPDANFRSYLSLIKDLDEDGDLSYDECLDLSIDVSGMNIASLKGIELFPELYKLDCSENQLTQLDLSHNPKLKILTCSENQLTQLDLSHNTELTFVECDFNEISDLTLSTHPTLSYLRCTENNLTTLDLSGCLALSVLFCSYNQLTAIDLSHNPALTTFYCSNNQLTALDLSKSLMLESIYCFNNHLSTLDLTRNTMLTRLDCYNNQIRGTGMNRLVATLPTVSHGTLIPICYDSPNEQNEINSIQAQIPTSKGWTVKAYNQDDFNIQYRIDVAHFPDDVFRQFVSDNYDLNHDGQLSKAEADAVEIMHVVEMGISDLTGIEYFTELLELYCNNSLGETETPNHLTSLDLSHNTRLTRLACGQNEISSLNISQCTELGNLHCAYNQLTNLNVTNNTKLWRLYCSYNQLSVINLSNNTMLKEFVLSGNNFTSLDLSGRTTLENLVCNATPLSQLNVSGCTALETLNCSITSITSLDLSTNTALASLLCSSTSLSTLDLSHNPNLTELIFIENSLVQSLDFSQNPRLKNLCLQYNALTSVSNLSNHLDLQEIDCIGNHQLTNLDLSGCTGLNYLYCYNNRQLATLDLSGCTDLYYVSCHDNQLTALDLSESNSLYMLDCSDNKISSLLVSPQASDLEVIYCYNNCLHGGEAVDAFFQSLPDYSQFSNKWGELYFKNTQKGNKDTNFCSYEQADVAYDKKWDLLNVNYYGSVFNIFYFGTLIGDLNYTGTLNSRDIEILVNYLLGKYGDEESNFDFTAADVNEDGEITLSDLTTLVNIIKNRTTE